MYFANDIIGSDSKPVNDGNKQSSVSEKPRKEVFKRPAGMSVELFRLIQGPCNEGLRESLIAVRTATSAYATAKFERKTALKWTKVVVIKNGLKRIEWLRQGDNLNHKEKSKEFPLFEALSFTDEEYVKHLQTEDWTKEETSYLLDLCHLFNLRWPAIDSRFRFDRAYLGSTKDMEDMKERYYDVFNKLKLARNAADGKPPLLFDAKNEKLRKEQQNRLMSRTIEQIAEEKELRAAVEVVKQKQKDRERKAIVVKRLLDVSERKPVSVQNPQLVQLESLDTNSSQLSCVPKGAEMQTVTVKRSAGRPRSGIPMIGKEVLDQLEGPAEARSVCQKFSCSHLRSQEFTLLSNIGSTKAKVIAAAVPMLEKHPRFVASKDVAVLYDMFISNFVLLQALKKALELAQDVEGRIVL